MKIQSKFKLVTILAITVVLFQNLAYQVRAEVSTYNEGVVITPIGNADDISYSMAIQSDGKIIVAGHIVNSGKPKIALVRYNPDGSLDNDFGVDGKVITNVYNCSNAFSLALQTDNKIVVTGVSSNCSSEGTVNFTTVRYNPDGSLDTTFDYDGIANTNMSGSGYDESYDLIIQSDNKILVVGYARIGTASGPKNIFALVRYNPDGSLDTSFDLDGKLLTDFSPGWNEAYGVALQADGKIVVSGYTNKVYDPWGSFDEDFAVARYNPDGSIDTSFGIGGKVITPVGGRYERAWRNIIQPDGKILILGNVHPEIHALIRYNSNGSLDTSFNGNGKVTSPSGIRGSGFVMQSDGKIIVAGGDSRETPVGFSLLRYNSDGTLDATFGSNGSVTTRLSAGNSYARAVALQSDGKILVAGISHNGENYDFALLRYLSDGSLDYSFGNRPPEVDIEEQYYVTEGDSVLVTADGNDPDGDSLVYSWDLNNDGVFETLGQNAYFSAEDLDGLTSYYIAVQVMDTGGLTGTDQAEIVIANEAPSLSEIIAPLQPMSVNTQVETSVYFSDPGKPDTHTAYWDWGDGTMTTGTVDEVNGSGVVSGVHKYTSTGVYTIRTEVIDDDGGSNQSIYQYVVIYNTDGGFVTGGGWIDSPVEAYIPEPTITGRANFGFVSKYKKGAEVPTGNTEFQFHAADLNFNSDNYEWLVVNQGGTRAQFKGTGTINGMNDPSGAQYKFMLWAGDDDPDTLRIKIWYEESDTEVVIYDNGFEGSGYENGQPIRGGNIVVHTK